MKLESFFCHNRLPCFVKIISSGQITHDTPEAAESLYPVLDVEQIEPFGALQYRMAPVLVRGYGFGELASSDKVEIGAVDSKLEDRDMVVHARKHVDLCMISNNSSIMSACECLPCPIRYPHLCL